MNDRRRISVAVLVLGGLTACQAPQTALTPPSAGSAPPAAPAAAAGTTAVEAYDSRDFAIETEAYISDDAGELAAKTGLRFRNPRCGEPEAVEPGNEYQCVADASDGQRYNFKVIVVDERQFRIEAGDPPVLPP